MKTNNCTGFLILIAIIFFGSLNISMAQADSKSKKKAKTYLTFEYFKKSDGSKLLFAKLKTKVNKKFVAVSGVQLSFTIETDSGSIGLFSAVTNNEGVAEYVIKSDSRLHVDDKGFTLFKAEYPGSELYKPKKKKISVKDLDLDIELETIDSVKTINITAVPGYSRDETDSRKIKLAVYVQRMFSQLKIADGTLKNGKCRIVFPNDIPGDSIGNIEVFVKIEDDDEYANVEKTQVIGWGIPVTEKESFKSSFSGSSYLFFWIISLLIAIAIFIVAQKTKVKANN